MKNIKTFKIVAIALSLTTIVSCRKDGLDEMAFTEETPSAIVSQTTAATAVLSDWKPVSTWNTVKKQAGTTWSGTIEDAAITSDIVNNGLILVFAKNGNAGQSLLYMQAGDAYWYYQVEAGRITINTETVNGNASIDKDQSFQYVMLSKEQLDELETKGVTRDDLVKLSWEEATTMFAK
jgi:hypothetical protein